MATPPYRASVLFYGDDFTGASDNAAQYARHGLQTQLFFNHPGMAALQEAAAQCDVVGIAGTARSLHTEAMREELLPVLQAFAQLQVPWVQYKCCSTFDSAAHTGSLGYAIGLMKEVWPDCFIPVHSATPEFGRYTLFGHHFARAGNEVYRLDKHPVMSVHPVTPMHESELAKVLLTQGFQTDHVLDVRQLDQHQTSPEHLTKMLASHHSAVVDGYTQQQVVTAAAALWRLTQQRQICAMSAQGLAHGLGQYLRESQHTQFEAPKQQLLPTDRLLVLSGSCSALSAAQIDHAEQAGFICLRLSNDALLDDVQTRMLNALSAGQSVVVFTARGREQSHDWPAGQLTQRIGACFAKLADAAFNHTALSRLVVAGGDSSSYTMRALGAEALQIKASHFAQNAHFAALVSAKAHIHGKEVLLKGGQVGDAQLYSLVLKGFSS
ncbi:MAG: four-carbon acid sugar kinase family protein [Betaproteobacteria bacterium]|nr:four-carbon acid sugar kinase family protein [Betaproteobacteria bacterium]NBY32971.1 four-carbon acid sugar kinase family protein [Betaproteobacteria bacterium]